MSRTILMRNYCQAACHPCTSPKTYKQKAVGVCILGAHTPTGEALAFLLKHNPLVSRIHLYGKRKVFGITIDLQHMDTRCRVTGHFGAKGLPASLRSADIILMLPETPEVPLDAPLKEHLKDQGKRVIELAEACSRYAPKAILTVCVPPISMTVPLVAFVFRRTPWYHPGRIIGSVALAQVQINSLTARFQGLDPTSVHVPLVGGPDIDTLVPLFSRAAPVGVSRGDAYRLLKQYRGTDEEVSMSKSAFTSPPLSTAYSLNQMVTTMALGLCGDPDAIGCAFVRTNVVPTCTHLVSTVRYSHGGVVHNYGIPKLTNMEFHIFHSACLVLKKREEAALDFLTHKDESPCKRSSRESQECSTVSN